VINKRSGKVIDLAAEYKTIPGRTISNQIYRGDDIGITVCSSASNTYNSTDIYAYHKLLTVYKGEIEILSTVGPKKILTAGQSFITPQNVPIGVKAKKDSIYTEIELRKECRINERLKTGEAFQLQDFLPFLEGSILNIDLVIDGTRSINKGFANDQTMKFVISSFDAGTGFSQHTAPGDTYMFALDGRAVIDYEGRKNEIHAGELIKFDKMEKHSISAISKFKMAQLLIL
jgi:quercetin dioxygenase-like cupin family protein